MRLLGAQLAARSWQSGEIGSTLPDHDGIQVSWPEGAQPTCQVTYPDAGERCELIAPPGRLWTVRLAVSDSAADEAGEWVEPPDATFFTMNHASSRIDGKKIWTLTGFGLRYLLDGELIGYEGASNKDGHRDWGTTSPGMLADLLAEVQERPRASGDDWFPSLSWTFTSTHDSAGNAWVGRSPLSMPRQGKISDLLAKWAGWGLIEWEMRGTEIYIVNPGGLSRDLTSGANPTILRDIDSTEAPEQASLADLTTDVDFVGDEGYHRVFSGEPGRSPIGRFVRPISQGSVSQDGTAYLYASQTLTAGAGPRESRTRASANGLGGPLPIIDVRLGDTVLIEGNSGREPSRVIGVSVTADKGGVTWHWNVGDRIDGALSRINSKAQAALVGAGVVGGDGTPPTVPGDDRRTPARVEGVTGAASTYPDTAGIMQGLASLGWEAVSTADDGTPQTPATYRVWIREAGSDDWAIAPNGIVPGDKSAVGIAPLKPDLAYAFAVEAVSENGRAGLRSEPFNLYVTGDELAPPRPTPPILESVAGTITVKTDGKGVHPSTGAVIDMPVDLAYFKVWDYGADQFDTPALAGQLMGNRETDFKILTRRASGVTYWVGLTAVDHAGNESPMSQLVSVVGRSIADDPDLVNDLGVELALDSAFIAELQAKVVVSDAFIGKTFEGGKFISRAPDGSRIEFTSSGYYQSDPQNRMVASWTPREGFRVIDPATGAIQAQLGKLANGDVNLAVRDTLSNSLIPLAQSAFGPRSTFRPFEFGVLETRPGFNSGWRFDPAGDVTFEVRGGRAFISFGATMQMSGDDGCWAEMSCWIYDSNGTAVYSPPPPSGGTTATSMPAFRIEVPRMLYAAPYTRRMVTLSPGIYTARLAFLAGMPTGAQIYANGYYGNRSLVVDPI